MQKRNWLCAVVLALVLGGCTASVQEPVNSTPHSTPTPSSSVSEPAQMESYRLPPPVFTEVEETELCAVAQDYLRLSDVAFAAKYPPDKLWEMGVYDRLLFTSAAKGSIVGGIAIGDPLAKVQEAFGESQFSTEEVFSLGAPDYQRYLLYGYKTEQFYFAFQIAPDTKTVQSVCIRRRYPLPEGKRDLLVRLATEYPDWYGRNLYPFDEADSHLEKERVNYAQWGRGTLTMICDYGFTTTSGMGDFYSVYADYEGDVPKLPPQSSEWTDGEDYEPVHLFETDYPEYLIYNIYTYLAEGEQAEKVFSPSGRISVSTRTGNPLELSNRSSLFENAHLVFHWEDGSQPDQQAYLGHFSRIIGFLNDRYLVECNMFGLHVYDIEQAEVVYHDDDLQAYNSTLTLDTSRAAILDGSGAVRYSYRFAANGDLEIVKTAQDT